MGIVRAGLAGCLTRGTSGTDAVAFVLFRTGRISLETETDALCRLTFLLRQRSQALETLFRRGALSGPSSMRRVVVGERNHVMQEECRGLDARRHSGPQEMTDARTAEIEVTGLTGAVCSSCGEDGAA